MKAVIEDLIEEHLLPSLLSATTTIEPSLNMAKSAEDDPALFHMISVNIDDVGPIFASSDALRQFAEDLKMVAVHGGIAQLESAFPKRGTVAIQVRRRGSALVFRNIEASKDDPKATLPTRLVGKLAEALLLAILSQETKRATHYGC